MLTEILIFIGIVAVVGLFVVRTDKRPEKCTCKHYNFFWNGPVNNCPAHKHYMREYYDRYNLED